MGTTLRAQRRGGMLRRAGVLTLAALAIAGCSAGGTEPAKGEGSVAEETTTSAEATEQSSEDIEFSEDTVQAAVEAAVPTSKVMTTEEIYAATEEQVAKLEESGSLDTCADLGLQVQKLHLEERRPTVQASVAEEALIAPGTVETVGVTPAGEIEGLDEVNDKLQEECQQEGTELIEDEKTVDGCEVVESQYTRDEQPFRWGLTKTCQGVTITYGTLATEGTDADYETWRAEADTRITNVFDQLAG